MTCGKRRGEVVEEVVEEVEEVEVVGVRWHSWLRRIPDDVIEGENCGRLCGSVQCSKTR